MLYCRTFVRQTNQTTDKMKTSIQLSDFTFTSAGYGHYNVTYTSPVTGKMFHATTNNMPLIDATHGNDDEPKKCDLIALKNICKGK